ncbi:hypothetical protein BRAO285_360027 [Bradyrhizobium sp. ORS 285]|nr:hypothetical protein BRAO285_360027 [Bradyrhizobium sp. ORS 285]
MKHTLSFKPVVSTRQRRARLRPLRRMALGEAMACKRRLLLKPDESNVSRCKRMRS